MPKTIKIKYMSHHGMREYTRREFLETLYAEYATIDLTVTRKDLELELRDHEMRSDMLRHADVYVVKGYFVRYV